MSFSITTTLKKIRRLKKRNRIIQGGTGAGKTIAILIILIDLCIKNPGLRVSVVSNTLPNLKKGAIRDFLTIMLKTGRFRRNEWNKSGNTYHFSNGSYIEFWGLEDEMKARGPRRDILFINEANRVSWSTALQLMARTAMHCYFDFNPTSRFWAHKELEGNDDTDFIIVTYKDNERCPQGTLDIVDKAIANLHKPYWKNWHRVFVLGEVGALMGLCIPEWTKGKRPKQAKIIGYGMDFGYTNDVTALIELSKFRDTIYIRQLIYATHLSSIDIKNIARKHKINFGLLTVADNDPRLINDLKHQGKPYWVIEAAKKPKDHKTYTLGRINEFNIVVDPDSKDLEAEIDGYSWETNKDDEAMNSPKDGNDHLMDALIYVSARTLKEKGKTTTK